VGWSSAGGVDKHGLAYDEAWLAKWTREEDELAEDEMEI
jgi:hypothetical protein